MDKEKIIAAQDKAKKMLADAGIAVANNEKIEICDYDLDSFENFGTEILIYVNTERCCAKELVLFPHQICPEHIHPAIGDYPGKEETFRCRWGEVYLYVPGERTENPRGVIPKDKEDSFTVWHEIYLQPGEQYTLKEQTLHWFQAGPEGAIISEFSTKSYDDLDIFTDKDILREGKF